MVSPFDETIESDSKIKSTEQQIVKKLRHKKVLMIERIIFLIIILALGTLICFNPYTCAFKDNEVMGITGNAILNNDISADTNEEKAQNTTTLVTDKNVVEMKPAKDQENIKIAESEADDEEKAQNDNANKAIDRSVENNLVFKIDEVDYLKDENDDDRPIKIKNIQVVIFNEWQTFKPKIIVYWYDDESSDAIKEKKREEITLKEVKFGVKQTITLEQFDSKFFDPQKRSEIIKLELYDEDTDKLLKTDKKIIE